LRKLVGGATFLALVAAPAFAQVKIVGTNKVTLVITGAGNAGAADNSFDGNDDNLIAVTQSGDANRVVVRQIGDSNEAVTDQISNNNLSAALQRGNHNVARIAQLSGNGNDAFIDQDVLGDRREASISQRGSNNRGTIIDAGSSNKIDLVQGFQSLLSHDAQGVVSFETGSVNNRVAAYMLEGSQAARNVFGVQGKVSDSSVFASIRGYDNVADVRLAGSGHRSDINMLGGGSESGASVDAETSKTQGNFIMLRQSGESHSAFYSVGSSDPSRGQGNRSEVAQAGSKHLLLLWQRGFYEKAAVIQSDSINSSSRVDPFRAIADVSQNSIRGDVAIEQMGSSYAQVTQGFGARSVVTVHQEEPAGPLDAPSATVQIAQNGNGNAARTIQKAADSKITIWQQVGSSSSQVSIIQGYRFKDSFGTFFEGATSVRADVIQSGEWNVTNVRQHGTDHATSIVQLGSGSELLPNRLRVVQRNASNEALAQQAATVGPSTGIDPSSGPGETYGFSGGARSAEILIHQDGKGSQAVVEQRGRGQYANILQSGERNRAEISQAEEATNATAVIVQSGNDNAYVVTQTKPGQYIHVTQSGSNNVVTDIIRRGPL
jgi:hypothetical protein